MNKKKCVIRKNRLDTYLNGKTLTFVSFCFKTNLTRSRKQKALNDENLVPNLILPRKQPGIYMIHCKKSDFRYYGESKNVAGRLASHKSMLNRQIHPSILLQKEWSVYGPEYFEFSVLYMGNLWHDRQTRRKKESLLIQEHLNKCYNFLETEARPKEFNPFWKKKHTPETKKKISQALKGRPNHLLGRKLSIQGVEYPSIAEASRQTKMARKTIRKKLNDPQEQDFREKVVKKARSNDHPEGSKI